MPQQIYTHVPSLVSGVEYFWPGLSSLLEDMMEYYCQKRMFVLVVFVVVVVRSEFSFGYPSRSRLSE